MFGNSNSSDDTAGEDGDTLLLMTHARDRDQLLRHLKLYKLRSKVKLSVRDDICLKAIRRDTADGHWNWKGFDSMLCAHNMNDDQSSKISENRIYRVYRYANGLWCDIQEIKDRIPLECNMDVLNFISFSKGCYVGQELIARTKYKGTNTLFPYNR